MAVEAATVAAPQQQTPAAMPGCARAGSHSDCDKARSTAARSTSTAALARTGQWYHATGMLPVAEIVSSTLSHREDILAAWVFGSTARGTASPGSDVDVAVLRGRPSTGTLDDLLCELASLLEGAVGRTVDLVVVDDADPDLVHRVLRDGMLVLDRDRSRRIAFEVRMRSLYFDLLPVREKIRRAAVERAKGTAT
jgi:predicted nucleotidyltransferase